MFFKVFHLSNLLFGLILYIIWMVGVEVEKLYQSGLASDT